VRARFQALLIGLMLFSAAAVIFAVWPGGDPVQPTASFLTPKQTARLTTNAVWVANQSGDIHPRRATVYATTREKLRHTLEGAVFHDPRPVYVLDLRGNFTVDHSAPSNASTISHGTQIMVVYDRKTLEATDFSIGWPRDLSQLGTGVPLQVP
jgi:hypothetical protein